MVSASENVLVDKQFTNDSQFCQLNGYHVATKIIDPTVQWSSNIYLYANSFIKSSKIEVKLTKTIGVLQFAG